MIRITALTGPHARKTREVPADIDSKDLLHEFLINSWEWKIDYTQATDQEAFDWGRQDIVCRALRALMRGLSVIYMGKRYEGVDAAGQLEDDIVASRRMIGLQSDDENGVVISTHGWEQ